ncbi:MAG: PAS domain-containing protein, partial [Phycisphaeraceae bacterium]|nr:PAS domain-containing protein [Phycisphaeraceae bacterium]
MGELDRSILEQIAGISKQAGDGIVLIDLAGTVLYANLAWVVMHKHNSAEDFIGKHLSMFHTEEEMNSLVTPFMEEAQSRGQFAGPVEHLRSDGTAISSQTEMTVTQGEEGEITGFVVIAMQPYTQNSLHEYFNQLEQFSERALS